MCIFQCMPLNNLLFYACDLNEYILVYGLWTEVYRCVIRSYLLTLHWALKYFKCSEILSISKYFTKFLRCCEYSSVIMYFFSLLSYVLLLGTVKFISHPCCLDGYQHHTNFPVLLGYFSMWRIPTFCVPYFLESMTWRQHASRCCWNRARRLTCYLSAPVTRKDVQCGTWTDSFLQRHYLFHPTTSGSRSG
jgi:hypothetical protein